VGHKYKELVLQVGGLNARLTTLLCKKIIVAKSKEVKTRSNLAELFKKGYGSKRTVLPMMMIINYSNS
jgi:hypothetical protein